MVVARRLAKTAPVLSLSSGSGMFSKYTMASEFAPPEDLNGLKRKYPATSTTPTATESGTQWDRIFVFARL